MKHQQVIRKGNFWRVCLLSLTLCFSVLGANYAQRPSPSVGVGFQAGNPTGLSLQFYKSHGISTDILFAYDFNDFFFLNIHGLWNTHLDSGGHFHLFYGPGGFVGIRSYRSDALRDEVAAGISGNFGLNLVLYRFEIFAQATPRLEVTPRTDFNMGGGAGLRFFF